MEAVDETSVRLMRKGSIQKGSAWTSFSSWNGELSSSSRLFQPKRKASDESYAVTGGLQKGSAWTSSRFGTDEPSSSDRLLSKMMELAERELEVEEEACKDLMRCGGR